MIPEPSDAPPRPDLTFLRRRARPAPAPPARSSTPIDYTRPDRRSTPAATDRTSSTGPSRQSHGGVDYTHPSREPDPPPPRPERSTAAPPASSGTGSSGALDLGSPAPVGAGRAREGAARRAPEQRSTAWHGQHLRRVGGAAQVLLGPADPTVTLTPVQSGVGELRVTAVCSDEVGDLRLGAFFQLRSGETGMVLLAAGRRFGPDPRRPLLVASHEDYEELGLDLRQSANLDRVAVFAVSESRTSLDWTGTLVTTTYGGGRAELPLDIMHPGRIAMLLTISNLYGELVVRAEMETMNGDVREAARAYGFDTITWRDERTPVD